MNKDAKYDPAKIELKWQKKWTKDKLYQTKEDSKKEKFFVLDMFPYPSGEGLHVGHPKGYIATDIISRFQRMHGKSVLHPMGFDAFGLPAENYAIKTKTNPIDSVTKNVQRYKEQLEILGFDYDWSREVNTTDPAYYKWTQWIFLQLYKKGLAYESFEPINWCPVDKTGLANEDVENGRCERCGALVEKKPMRQWVLKITDYADRLLADLDTKKPNGDTFLDWPHSIKEAQRNWIGKSEGAEIEFTLKMANNKPRFVLIHGYKGSPEQDFFPWLKKELEKRGHEVQVPALPNPENPKESEQVDYVINNCTIDENTVIVAHSLGGVVAQKALMKLNKQISGLVLVGTAITPGFSKESKSRLFHKNFTWDFDYVRINKLAQGRVAILSDTKEIHRGAFLKDMAGKLSGAFIETPAVKEHFTASEEPAILKCVTPTVSVFTTRPDTIFGVTYIVLAPEHPWVSELLSQIENKAEVEAYIAQAKLATEIERTDAKKEKTGVELKGIRAINPANSEEVPVWIADYVLADYGTGVVMAVPAHDERDFAFAKKFGLPTKHVVMEPITVMSGITTFRPDEPIVYRNVIRAVVKHWSEDKYLVLTWKDDGRKSFISGGIEGDEDTIVAAKREIEEETGYTDLDFISYIGGKVRARFYAPIKNQNREDLQQGILFQLKSNKNVGISEAEQKIHAIEWMSLEDARKVMDPTLVDFITVNRLIANNQTYTGEGVLCDSGSFTGKDSGLIKKDITLSVGGQWVSKYKLRDWVFSRQRYWGEPIPLIHCKKCGVVPVPEKDLPVKLPKVKSYEPTGTGESPLADIHKWVNVKCPKCKSPAKRETNTMPQWAGSSWYYLRYMDPKNKNALVDPKKEKYWAPVDMYVGGAEHATRHLIYARFWHKFLYDIGTVSTTEPFIKLQHVGLIMGEDGRKMSKRFGNVVNPDDIVKAYGADTMRLYEMFMGPFDQQIAWSTSSMVGVRRFIEKVWRLRETVSKKEVSQDTLSELASSAAGSQSPALLPKRPSNSSSSETVNRILHKTIKKVTADINTMSFNTAVSTLMIAVNELEKIESITRDQFELLLKLLAPFAPHAAEELWYSVGNKTSVHISSWPVHDESLIVETEVNIIVQVNGKVRASFKVEVNTNDSELEARAKDIPEVKKWLDGRLVKKVIVVKGKLVSIVVV
ncbi:MAG: class I tRNA ligase family protein [Candidatus Pacebacteria bacterium]|nr:class I tRNA ligase family protein [Candidatus Paceibacterota bacterium]